MIRMLKDWSLALVIVFAVIAVGSLFRSKPEVQGEAPPISLATLDGATFDLAEHRGNPVVINFWAGWCAPCKAEIPEFSDFADEHPDVRVLGLAVESGDETEVRRLAESFGITYAVGIADADVVTAYDVSTLPTTIIVDSEGQVAEARVGTMSKRDLERAVF